MTPMTNEEKQAIELVASLESDLGAIQDLTVMGAEEVRDALDTVLRLAKRPYALGEGHRDPFRQLLEDKHGDDGGNGKAEHCNNPYCKALTAALTLAEPFTKGRGQQDVSHIRMATRPSVGTRR